MSLEIGARRTAPEECEDEAIELTGLDVLLTEPEAIKLRDELTAAIDKPRLDARPEAEVIDAVGRYTLLQTKYEWCVRETLNPDYAESGGVPEYVHLLRRFRALIPEKP